MPSPESDSLTVSPSQPKLAVRVIAVTSAAKTVFSSTSLPSAVSQPPNASPATSMVAVGKVPIAVPASIDLVASPLMVPPSAVKVITV